MAPYRAPPWLPGGHAQTIYASLAAPRPRVAYRRERWDTPDGDFIDLDWVAWNSGPGAHDADCGIQDSKLETRSSRLETQRPLVVLFHGLEGSSRSHYARALMAEVARAGWRGCVVHFRGCGGEPNRRPRAYHSGDSAELDWILRRLRSQARPLYAAGVSLGGNVLLKWLGEAGAEACTVVEKAAAISAPVDLTAAGEALDRGFNRIYAWHFLASMKKKAFAKLARYPGLFDAARLRAANTLRAFDDLVTAPLHGFRGAEDYWKRASAKPWLARIAVPTLMVNALDDPFLPAAALPARHEVSSCLVLEQPAQGGHVGFVAGPFPGHLRWLPRRVMEFFGAGQW
ncbi:MAG TPA: alpha/beta fold hydrolase [Burkholderiales bacterium]|nr:alpha/beta fold hydrolase [Burkholderiales bacterium]